MTINRFLVNHLLSAQKCLLTMNNCKHEAKSAHTITSYHKGNHGKRKKKGWKRQVWSNMVVQQCARYVGNTYFKLHHTTALNERNMKQAWFLFFFFLTIKLLLCKVKNKWVTGQSASAPKRSTMAPCLIRIESAQIKRGVQQKEGGKGGRNMLIMQSIRSTGKALNKHEYR